MPKAERWNEIGRICTKCQEFKSWSEYSHKSSKRYGRIQTELHKVKQPWCKPCGASLTKHYNSLLSFETKKDRYYKRTYGISLDEFNFRFEKQNGLCLICERELQMTHLSGDSVVVDHCHINGHVRGLLCNECNRGLGYFKDNINSLSNAIKYLRLEGLTRQGGPTSCRT